MRLAQRLQKLEADQGEGLKPWVYRVWDRGDPEPEIPPGHRGLIVRIVKPGDPPGWLKGKGMERVL